MPKVLNFVFGTFLGVITLVRADFAMAQTPRQPRIKAPTFPNEPDKKPDLPINPETYVEAKTEPPTVEETAIPKVGRDEQQWWNSFDLGWFYGSQTANHGFSTTVVSPLGMQTAKRTSVSLLSIQGRVNARPPLGFFSLIAQASAASGSSNATVSSVPGATSFNANDIRAMAGLRVHFTKRESPLDLRIGADLCGALANYATLTTSQTAIDVDSRQIISWVPRAEIAYDQPNWGVLASAGSGLLLSSGGTGDVRASNYQRLEFALTSVRYITPGNGIGIGAAYADESVTWVQTLPSVLSDRALTSDLRLSVFWRSDF